MGRSVTQKKFFNRAIYKIMRKSILEPGRPQMTILRMRIVCWIPKATNTHSECIIIIAFLLQQWLHERALTSRYTYIVLLLIIINYQEKRGRYHSQSRDTRVNVILFTLFCEV